MQLGFFFAHTRSLDGWSHGYPDGVPRRPRRDARGSTYRSRDERLLHSVPGSIEFKLLDATHEARYYRIRYYY